MGSIKVILPDELEKEFRDEVFRRMGMRKGNITLAIQEAIRMWIKQRGAERGVQAHR